MSVDGADAFDDAFGHQFGQAISDGADGDEEVVGDFSSAAFFAIGEEFLDRVFGGFFTFEVG